MWPRGIADHSSHLEKDILKAWSDAIAQVGQHTETQTDERISDRMPLKRYSPVACFHACPPTQGGGN